VMLYTDERSANLDLLYVLPEHRTGWGRKLFNEFLRWGRANASRIVVGTGTGIDRAEVLFRRAGFKSTGKQYMMEV
jgi:GNAT superfamily N-acetyltransferase